MANKINDEFNYRFQVKGETVWERIRTLQGFKIKRTRDLMTEGLSELKYAAKLAEYNNAKSMPALLHVILLLKAEVKEFELGLYDMQEAYDLNREELVIIDRLLAELFVIAEPTRVKGYTDEQMFELNALNEYTTWLAKEVYAEQMATGTVSATRIRQAMNCPATFKALQDANLLPSLIHADGTREQAKMITGSVDPLKIQLSTVDAISLIPYEQLP